MSEALIAEWKNALRVGIEPMYAFPLVITRPIVCHQRKSVFELTL